MTQEKESRATASPNPAGTKGRGHSLSLLPLPDAFIDGKVGVPPDRQHKPRPPWDRTDPAEPGHPQAPSLLFPGPGATLAQSQTGACPVPHGEMDLGAVLGTDGARGTGTVGLRESTSARTHRACSHGTAQGLLRLAWLSIPVLAARLFRWCGKVGISSGSQAVGHREGSAGPKASQSCPAPGWGILTQGLLLEVGALQAVLGCGPVGGNKGKWQGLPQPGGQHGAGSLPYPPCIPAWLLPFLGVIHEEEVEQSQPSL